MRVSSCLYLLSALAVAVAARLAIMVDEGHAAVHEQYGEAHAFGISAKAPYYNGDEATITVKVNVYDLYKAQKDATTYLAENPNEFKDEDGKYDAEKFITYKLDKMKETNEKTSYTIDFYVVNTSDGWTVSSLSNSDIEKLHGIYDYES